jgi:hypothetical protein
MVAVGCGVLAAFALGIGGLTMLWADRPDTETTGPVERTALDLPLIPADDTHDASTGERPQTDPRDADDAEVGEPSEGGADANLLGDGTVPSGDQPDQGGEGVPGEGTGTGGSGGSGGSGSGPGAGGGTGTGGGGTTTPTTGPPPPTSDPTADPTEEPTPKPTPTASDEPSPEPSPSPSVSPSATPTGAPVSPNTGG